MTQFNLPYHDHGITRSQIATIDSNFCLWIATANKLIAIDLPQHDRDLDNAINQ
ncbi:hypothetical protein [Chamaesiphon sp. VAR_69_metabat_338]|uniref:hypothetical protein n=1 Tax=Chamaesiphon sp. VAR_69_metabat_338 TaxID=2964704 RepID=UPI00286DC09A|nr:hypothetical protein [Chamaesiphon sp. VAR_69_metabat_338]